MISIEEAREQTLQKLRDGQLFNCPCCDQTVKLYARKISAPMSRQLIRLYRNGATARNQMKFERDDASCRNLHWWGLIVLSRESADGKYRITQKGRDFVEGKITLPKYVFTYNSAVLDASPEQVTLSDCLGERWDFAEMVNTPPPAKVA